MKPRHVVLKARAPSPRWTPFAAFCLALGLALPVAILLWLVELALV